ncbi:MAG TPA: hypothetical protein VM325_01610 [Alphaproteobacteria bacterium]|nr:hypothetical protein [Alphaproteobacteria bacterium]
MAMNFDTLWRNIVKRLTDEYADGGGDAFVLPTTKSSALDYLDNLKRRVEAMEEFSAFPEGDPGIVVFALLWDRAGELDHSGEFGQDRQGLAKLMETFGAIAEKEDPWSASPLP